jgi:hypothetical protein
VISRGQCESNDVTGCLPSVGTRSDRADYFEGGKGGAHKVRRMYTCQVVTGGTEM